MTRIVLRPLPHSASEARQFASAVLTDWGEVNATDVVQLLISELVTNAILHGGTKVDVSLQRRTGRLRVEVGDESPFWPFVREPDPSSTTGRGLELLEALSNEWGVDPRTPTGKVVWFEIDALHREPRGVDRTPVLAEGEPSAAESLVAVHLGSAPAQLFAAMTDHLGAVLREYALMTVDPRMQDWQAPTLPIDFNAVAARVSAALEAGATSVDMDFGVPMGAAAAVERVKEALVKVDRTEAGQLLTPPALPEIRECREWFLAELTRQLAGEEPHEWWVDVPATGKRDVTDVDLRQVLDALIHGIVVSDDENNIVFANRAAEELLGWDSGALVGRRLTVIIPERLHQAHIAGFSRYLVRQESRILGQPVRVPARRRDGTEVDVELLLQATHRPNGRMTFVGTILAADRIETKRVRWEADALLASVLHLLAVPVDDPTSTVSERVMPILRELCNRVAWQFAAWWTPKDDVLECIATWHAGTNAYERFTTATMTQSMARGTGLPGRVWAAGEPVWVTDVVADANFARSVVALESGLRTGCGFPVLRDDGVLAVIELFSEWPSAPQPSLMAALAHVGRLIGLSDIR